MALGSDGDVALGDACAAYGMIQSFAVTAPVGGSTDVLALCPEPPGRLNLT